MQEHVPPAEVVLDATATAVDLDGPPQQDKPMRHKSLSPMSLDHPIAVLWRDESQEFRKQIKDILESEPRVDWRSMLVVRYGYEPDPYESVDPEEAPRPVLWIGLRPATAELEYLQEDLELAQLGGYGKEKERKKILAEIEAEKARLEADKHSLVARIEEAKRQCKSLLEERGLSDVGVEMHEERAWGAHEYMARAARDKRRAEQGK